MTTPRPRTGAAPTVSDPPPSPPGSLDDAPISVEILHYLTAVTAWRDRLRDTLDRLDQRARVATGADDLVPDITLAYGLWQSIAARIDEVVAVWDSGRVLDEERAKIAKLLWGRLGGTLDVVLAVSFAEACVLADALVGRLRTRLDADPLGAAGVGERIAPLHEQLTRCRAHDTGGERTGDIDALVAALEACAADAAGGHDVRDRMTAIEHEASVLERDLIMANAARTSIERDAARLEAELAATTALADEVRALAARCTDRIVDAPRLAVPDPSVLGPVPSARGDWRTTRAALDAFDERLTQVERALAHAHERYRAPLAKRDELRQLLDAYRAMAASRGHAENHELHQAYVDARAVLYAAPLDLAVGAEALVGYERAMRAATMEDDG